MFVFEVEVGKCTRVFLESIRNFSKDAKSLGSRSNQVSFQNIRNF